MSDAEISGGGSPREWVVPDGAPAERMDKVLAAIWSDLSRSRLQDLIRDGRVTLDGAEIRDPGRRIGGGARVVLTEPPPAPAEPQGEAIALAIVYEDSDLVVLDKPAGLVVHPAAGHGSGTLVNALIAHCGASLSGIGGVRRPGIVHRLDKDTSGLLVVAKNDRAHQGLAAQFADHGRTGPLERSYAALVWGVPDRHHGTISASLARSTHNREKITVVPDGSGRAAITHYAVLEELPGMKDLPGLKNMPGVKDLPGAPVASLVRCTLETGRTHQIRVHMAHLGHPLLGDGVYGSGFKTKASRLDPHQRDALGMLGRQALHAAVLGFAHPRTGKFLRFESALPEDLQALLDALRGTG